jgi:hypothetical protein
VEEKGETSTLSSVVHIFKELEINSVEGEQSLNFKISNLFKPIKHGVL